MKKYKWTRGRTGSIIVALALAACAPRLDWREVRADEAGLAAMFPCKPERFSRAAEGANPRGGLLVCQAAGQSFSISWSVLNDPAMVTPALRMMREALVRKLAGSPSAPVPVALPGMTPNAQAGRLSLAGRGADGRVQHAELLVFARGLLVYQVMMLGSQADASAWESFVGGLKLGSP